MILEPGRDYIITRERSVQILAWGDSPADAVGGFHTLCADVGKIKGHLLSGYPAGTPLPASFWNLHHRARAGNNAGMVYDS